MENKVVRAKPGSLVIVHYHQAHGFNTGNKSLDILNLYLDTARYHLPPLASPLNKTLYHVIPLHAPFGHGLRRLIHLQFEEVEPMAHLLFSLKCELEENKPGMTGLVENYLRLLAKTT